jgi:lysophospholipase L1-like esterase
MGAWYVMSAMGLFQMDGGASVKPFYEIGSPVFEKITIHLNQDYYPGEKFVILADNVSPENRYIQSAMLNGKVLDKPWFYHEDLVKGGTLEFEMGPVPNENWGSDPADAPPSMSSLLSQDEISEILAFDRNAAGLEEWNRALRAYYYHRKEQFESLPDTPGEIIMLGNSITDQAEWHEMFGSLDVKNRGIGGDDTDGILERLDEVLESKPAKIFIMIGTNDLAYGKGVDHVISNYRKILETINEKTPGTEVYIQSVLPTNDAIHFTRKNTDIMEINRQLEELAREEDMVYINLYSAFVTPDNKLNPEYSIDGLHLNGKGYKLWVSLISEYVGE